MGFLSRFEGKMEDTLEGAADKMFAIPLSPAQIAKKAEKQMRRQKIVGAGRQYAPTLYTVLVNEDDDQRLFGYYPTLAGELETRLSATARAEGLVMDGQPLVRFIADAGLKRGKFEVIAEAVAAPIIAQLRDEELERYGLAPQQSYSRASYDPGYDAPAPRRQARAAAPAKEPLPYVPEDEIDYSIDYGEYTFNSQDFEDYRQNGPSSIPLNSQGWDYDGNYDESDGYDDSYDNYDDYGEGNFDEVGGPVYDDDDANYEVQNVYYDEEPEAPAPRRQPAPAQGTMEFAGGMANPMPNNALVRAKLTETMTGKSYMLAANRLLVGRSSTCDICIKDINVSRTHAEIRFEPQGIWSITDLGSANGTFVNDTDVESCPLAEGDIISMGTTDFIFSLA